MSASENRNDELRRAFMQYLVKIAIAEGVLLAIVLVVYLYTKNLTYLIGGVIGAALIFGPMIYRRGKELQEAQKRQRDLGGGNG